MTPALRAGFCVLLLGPSCALTLFFLLRDVLRPPFLPILREAELDMLARDVVLMHHKRLPELNATLHSLASASGARRLRVTVAQALDEVDAPAAAATAALLRSLTLPFRSLSHSPLLSAPGATSYSTDASRYGTKRGSCRNLLHGLDTLFAASPPRAAALVLEDDVRLAPDVVDFFDLAASVVAASGAPGASGTAPRVTLASAFCYPRDSHEDYASTQHLPGRLLAGRPDSYRRSPLRSLTFRTLAWLVTREVYDAMSYDFASGPEAMLALPESAPLHTSMRGCAYCENLCYDHWLEWRWREAAVVCPAQPRAEAIFSGGMTEHRGILGAGGDEGYHARLRAGTGLLSQQRVPSSAFVDDVDRRAATRHLRRLGVASLLALLASAAWWLTRRRGSLVGRRCMGRDKTATGEAGQRLKSYTA